MLEIFLERRYIVSKQASALAAGYALHFVSNTLYCHHHHGGVLQGNDKSCFAFGKLESDEIPR